MKFPQLLLYLGFSLLMSCKPFDMVTYLHSIKSEEALLPNLQPVWDEQQFYLLFPVTPAEGPPVVPGLPNSRALDIQIMYTQMIEGGISQISGDPSGYAVLDLDIRSQRTGLTTLFHIANYGLLGLPLLAGLPKEQCRVDCIAIVKILTSKDELLGTYMGTGHLKGMNNLYLDHNRKWSNEVFALAMQEIKQQIRADHSRLAQGLK